MANIKNALIALENQHAILGDAVENTALSPMKQLMKAVSVGR